jgi:selenocysteine lyase/cysteine desulfurase
VAQSADGHLVDLDALRAVREVGTRVVLDATQSVGWLPAPLGWADAVVCAGYKWLLCPRGVAWMAVHPSSTSYRSTPTGTRAATSGPDVYGLPLRLAGSARRFDTSPTWFSHVGAAAALPWLACLNREAVHVHCVELADAVGAGLDLQPAGSAIVTLHRLDAAERLAAAGVVAT